MTTRPRARRGARAYFHARLKALAGGASAAGVFVVTALLLSPTTQDTVTAWVPDWLRPVLPLVFVVGAYWAVERTKYHGTPAPEEE